MLQPQIDTDFDAAVLNDRQDSAIYAVANLVDKFYEAYPFFEQGQHLSTVDKKKVLAAFEKKYQEGFDPDIHDYILTELDTIYRIAFLTQGHENFFSELERETVLSLVGALDIVSDACGLDCMEEDIWEHYVEMRPVTPKVPSDEGLNKYDRDYFVNKDQLEFRF